MTTLLNQLKLSKEPTDVIEWDIVNHQMRKAKDSGYLISILEGGECPLRVVAAITLTKYAEPIHIVITRDLQFGEASVAGSEVSPNHGLLEPHFVKLHA